MTTTHRHSLLLVSTIAVASLTGLPRAAADESADRPDGTHAVLRADIEADPVAYALDGHSVHAGIRYHRWRLDLGAFAIEVPETFHGNDGLELYSNGYGVKLDVHPLGRLPGLFVGAAVNVVQQHVSDPQSAMSVRETQLSIGGRVGYQFDLPGDFYVAPWVGVDTWLGDLDLQVGTRTFEGKRVTVFPTVHLGRTF